MRWTIRTVMAGGKMAAAHVYTASAVVGRLQIGEERDSARKRTMRFASVIDATPPERAPGRLYDVQIVASEGSIMRLAGYEIVETGPLCAPVMYAQTWHLEPFPDEELARAERQVSHLSKQVHELTEQLAAAKAQKR